MTMQAQPYLDVPSMHNRVSAAEWKARVELAACYRLAHHLGWAEDSATHISARVPDEPDCFLLNPSEFMFEEVTASCLIKVDMDGNLRQEAPYRVNEGGFTIHSAVYLARPDAMGVVHTHSMNGVAISAMEGGLKTLTQSSARFHKRIAYHDYAGPAGPMDERARIGGDLGPHLAMIMKNHGLLTAGRTIGESFIVMARLEQAIAAQIHAQQTGDALIEIPEDLADAAAANRDKKSAEVNDAQWLSWMRRADRLDPGYRQ